MFDSGSSQTSSGMLKSKLPRVPGPLPLELKGGIRRLFIYVNLGAYREASSTIPAIFSKAWIVGLSINSPSQINTFLACS